MNVALLRYSDLNRSCNATVKAEVTHFLTLIDQSRASLMQALIGQRITSALTVALQDLFKARCNAQAMTYFVLLDLF